MLYSLLIAVRNETQNLPFLFESLRKLAQKNDLKNQLEILFGDDDSTDNSANLITDFIQNNPQINAKLYDITTTTHTQGKANVLAQLAEKAQGDIFFYTDADMQLPVGWVESFENEFTKNTKIGIAIGVTIPIVKGFFSGFQAIEWVFALTIMKIFAWFGVPITGMGNNMAICKKAYWEVGGYAKIPFSVVEDYAIFWAIIRKKWDFNIIFSKKNLAYTQAIKGWYALLQQRNRWMRGAMAIGWWFSVLLFVQFLAMPVLLILGFLLGNMLFFWIIFVIILGKWGIIFVALCYLQKLKMIFYLPIYELYNAVFSLHLLVFYFSQKKIIWKERKF